MSRIALARCLIGATLLSAPAAAHMVWLERDGTTVQLFFGEPADGLRERTGGTLDLIASPRLMGAATGISRQPDHVAFAPVPTGDAWATEESLAPREDRQRGGRTRTIFLAREGRSESRSLLSLDLVPAQPGNDSFTLLFRGQPVPRATVELIGPPGWTKALRTDAAGVVTLPLPWAGRYVAEVQHLVEEQSGEGQSAHDRIRYVATLSFVVDRGLPWTSAPSRP